MGPCKGTLQGRGRGERERDAADKPGDPREIASSRSFFDESKMIWQDLKEISGPYLSVERTCENQFVLEFAFELARIPAFSGVMAASQPQEIRLENDCHRL